MQLTFAPLTLLLACATSVVLRAEAPIPHNSTEDQSRWEALLIQPKYRTWAAFQYVQEQPGLPRALIIGDSISISYTLRVQEALRGKVNVWRIPVNGGSTEDGLANLASWLAWRDHWDVIQFNFGLHDITRRREGSTNPDQPDVTGTTRVPLKQYERNLRKLARKLKATGAEVIWAATTPVPENSRGRVPGDEVAYNEVAAKVMAEEGVRVNDLHAFISPHLETNPKLQETVTTDGLDHHDVHFTDPGDDLLAPQVAEGILQALEKRGVNASANTKRSLTLRSHGAVGDGKTDDREAIEKALRQAQGVQINGEGLTYAVRGNIEVEGDAHFTDATLIQTMDPPDTRAFLVSANGSGAITVEPPDALTSTVLGLPYMLASAVGTYAEDPVPTARDLERLMPGIALRTLTIHGTEGKPAAVKLERVNINRGHHPQSGGRNDASGLRIEYGSPVAVSDANITGDGKGKGLEIVNCADVRLERVRIHDMNWAPYDGDNILDRLTAIQVKDDFRWNNFPIYEYRDSMKRFVRVRIQEQLVGLWISLSQNVEVADCTVEALQVNIGGELFPLQADGMTLNRISGIKVRNSRLVKVWEGIDFTGGGGDNFTFEDCVAEDCLSWGFKLAHPKQNGRLIRCRADRSGLGGFVVGAKSENITLTDCLAMESGAPGYLVSSKGEQLSDVVGIIVEGMDDLTTPKDITIQGCAAINEEHPGAMAYGILCQAPLEGRNIVLKDSRASGAKIANIRGFGAGNDTTGLPALNHGIRTASASGAHTAVETR